MVDIASIRAAISNFAASCQMLEKSAFVPGPQGGPPPGDPNAMPPGGDPNAMPPGAPPPGDPNAMPPGGDPNAMPPPGDPNAMPPGGDPNAMPPGGAPPAGGPPPGGMPPELEQVLSEMGGGMQEIAQTVEQQQATVEQLGSRQLEIENKLQELSQLLKGPAPFEGSTKGPKDVAAEAGAPAEEGPVPAEEGPAPQM